MNAERDNVGSLLARWRHGFRRIRQTPDWATFAGSDWLDRIMSVDVTDKLFKKQGRSIARWTLISPDGKRLVVFLKRHFELPWKDGVRALLFPRRARSPGLQEWEHLEWAARQGLPVPRAVAAGELVGPHGQLQSFIAVEELADQLPLHEAIPLASRTLDANSFRRWKRTLASELVRLSIAFHSRGAYHKDWYLCHFYIDEADTRRLPDSWESRVTVIDLHRLNWHKFTGPWRKAKDLGQLLYSSDVPGVTDRDRLWFWSQYRQAIAWPRLVKQLALAKFRLYRRKNATP